MRGHVARKGDRYYPVVDLGMQPARRCTTCRRRSWLDQGRRDACPKCGGELKDTQERRQQWHEGHDRKKDASTALTELLRRHDRGTYIEPSRLTVAAFLVDEWLPAIETTIRPSTLLSYRGHVTHHLAPRIGSTPLQKLTPAAINALYAELLTQGRADKSGALSHATVRRVHATLHRALKDAVRWNRLARNPADAADPPKASADDADQTNMATWTADELRTFLDGVADDRLFPLWLTYATTGVRRGEGLGLRAEDVDLDAGRAEIRQTLIAVGYEVKISRPKTKRGRRSVPLEATTVAALRSWRKRRTKERLAWGPGYQDCGLLFTREDGSAIHPDRVSKLFDGHVARLGLPRIRLHDLRHTFCTLALRAGVHPKVVSEIAGHASVSITLDVYSHAIPAMQEDAAGRVASLVFGDGR